VPTFAAKVALGLRDDFTRAVVTRFDRLGRAAERVGKRIGRALGRGARGAAKAFGGVAKGVAGVASGAAIAGVAAARERVINLEESLTDLQVQGGLTAEETENFRGVAAKLSKQTGIAKTDVLGAAKAMVNLEGKAGASAKKMDVLTRATVAVKEVDDDAREVMDDLAGVMFALNAAFFEGKGSAEELEGALSAAIEAGKQGSIPLGEMGTVLQQVASQFKSVTGRGTEGAADLAAALQVARVGFGSAAEAGTGLKALIGSLTGNAKLFNKHGVKVFNVAKDGTKTLKPLREIFTQIGNSKLAKDPTLLQKAFGSKEALIFFQALDQNVDKWNDISSAARESTAVADDFFTKNASKAAQARQAMNDVDQAFEKAFNAERLEGFNAALKALAAGIGGILDGINAVSNALGNAIIDVSGIEEKLQKKQEAQSLELRQAQEFSTGKIGKAQSARAARHGVVDSELQQIQVARLLVRDAEREGFIKDGQVQTGKVAQRSRAAGQDKKSTIDARVRGLQEAMALAQANEGRELRTSVVDRRVLPSGEVVNVRATNEQAKQTAFTRDAQVLAVQMARPIQQMADSVVKSNATLSQRLGLLESKSGKGRRRRR